MHIQIITLILLCLAKDVFSTNENVLCKLGDSIVLKSDSDTNSPSSILWRLGQNKVADFDKDFGTTVSYYGEFNSRTTLDTTTGELKITGLRKTDEGVYSVEFNSKRLEKTYTLSVLKPVPKPAIIVSCNDNKISCTLTCDGDTAGAEPVTYWWKVGEGNWENIGKLLTVTKSDSKLNQNGYKYTCKLKNGVSEKDSDPVGPLFDSKQSTNVGSVIGWILFTLLLIAVIISVGFCVWRNKTGPPNNTLKDFRRSVLFYFGGNKEQENQGRVESDRNKEQENQGRVESDRNKEQENQGREEQEMVNGAKGKDEDVPKDKLLPNEDGDVTNNVENPVLG
ncbi:SLAM family member 7-like isoform X4 [Esox lucius]|uniref:SLAM family member 7-like isoform X3 n=1 Tax=Esox lucius TaxID=8010 RepID=UPI001476EF93|nr:SLAM family member 7-like isoform X3 [Esox lucius]XP_034145410.1 SLAM family member 7-like isoform X4 [Esox lucius]